MRLQKTIMAPKARRVLKPGKPGELYYNGQIAVDTAHHVITHAESFTADGKDCRDLITIAEQLQTRLQQHGIKIEKLLADGAYSNGENYQYLEQQNITPLHTPAWRCLERLGRIYL